MSLWGKSIRISDVFLLYVVGEEEPIGFFWLLYWYLPHVANIIAEGFWCCPIL